jgi:hypothetical protein
MSWMKDSNSLSNWLMSWRLVSAMAAWEASDSASRWSAEENGSHLSVSGSIALISCSTPMTAFSWFFIGTVRKDCER